MTLDDRIKKDLDDLYNKGEIDGAKALDGLITAKNGQTSFATKALPCYYWGDRSAKTVLVMLNPGEDVNKANNNLKCELNRRSMKNAADITMYNDWSVNYGHYDKNRHDNFDLKQAFFLRHWKDCGVDLYEDNLRYIIKNQSSNKNEVKAEVHKRQLEEKRKVLMEKRQLELVPYASRSFSSINKKNISKIFPYVETLLHEIFSYDRTYVIFCSAKFEEVFQAYSGDKKYPGTIDFIDYKKVDYFNGSKLTVSCSVIRINYGNKSIKAIIANTFPNQALPNAYDLMAEYGKFCYNCLLKHLP